MASLTDTVATIPNGGDSTNAVDTGSLSVVGFVFGATYTNASFTLQNEIGGAWVDVKDDLGNAVTVPSGAGYTGLLPEIAYRVGSSVRLKGAGAEGAIRTIRFVTRAI